MSTVSIAQKVVFEAQICQGDIYKDVHYSYINDDTDDSIEIVDYTFPTAIVISQACDVDFMSKILDSGSGKVNKFMPAILMCPIYDKDEARKMSHLDDAFCYGNVTVCFSFRLADYKNTSWYISVRMLNYNSCNSFFYGFNLCT